MLRRNLRLNHWLRAGIVGCFGILAGDKFQPRNRADDDGAIEPRDDAPLPRCRVGAVARHVQVVRAHVGKGAGVVGAGVLGGGNLQPLHVQLPLVGAAMEQVDVTQKAIHERARRAVPHLLGRAFLLDAAFVDHDHAVGHLQRLLLVVGDEDAGHVQLVVQAAQPAAQFLPHLGVERAKGLVEQQYLGLHGQRPRQGNALALPARELRRKALGHPVELHHGEQLHDLGADLRLARSLTARLHTQAKGDVVEHRHVPKQRVVLKDEAHAALAHVHCRLVLAGEGDAAGVRLL